MRRFRNKPSSPTTPTNSLPSTPSLPIVKYIKQELAASHPRVKDLKALAASSSFIALSIASPSCDPADNAADESGSSNDSVWKTAYGAARMTVEIANASSDMFLPLKAVVGALSVLIKNYDQTAANADQVTEVEERIRSLGEILAHPIGDHDNEEKARREGLRRKLTAIIAKLKPLSTENGIVKFFKNADYATILNGFVQDLANAVTDYQQSIHGDVRRIDETIKKFDESAQNIIEAADLELLGRLNPVRNAGYQAGHHDTCLRGTRESVLGEVIQWAENPQDRHVFWLNGLAGTGKSTIAQTLSEMLAKTETLGASFFCSRDYLDRNELKNIFPTLSHQLACRYPAFRAHIIKVIKRDPHVAQNSLISQLKDLIVNPLSSTNIPCVIVIDALDECIDDQPGSALLSVLAHHVGQLTFVKFFITGRPELRIRTGFRLRPLEELTQIFLLHEVKLSDVDEDIRLYLQEKLTGVAKRRSNLDLSDPWPRDEDLIALTKKSSGLFIFASTLVKFIESEYHEPNERLGLSLAPSDSTVHEGRAGINPLYLRVLTLAFSDAKDDKVFADLRRVLGAVILAFNPLSREQIAGILVIEPNHITPILRHLHSVLLVPNEGSKEIRVFHKSFPDFLQDHDRCPDQKFFIDSPTHHGAIALDCLVLLKKLKPNPCDLPDFVMNRDVANLPDLLEDKVGGATRYACGYWAMHVRSSPTTNDYAIRLIPSATEFFEKNAVSWIEVMSLENRLESVIHSIYNLLEWIGMVDDAAVSDLRSLAEDTLRFTMHFFHLIQQSAPHIYHSALPLSPRSSTFLSRTLSEKTEIIGFDGRTGSWGIVVRTITAGSNDLACMTTFGNRIAAAYRDGRVNVYDSVTGVLRLSFRHPNPASAIRGSPDGSVLFCAHKTPSITAWDMQTGGLIHNFVLEWNAEEFAVSLKGRYLACVLSDRVIEVYEVTDKTEGGAVIWCTSPVTPFCWLEPEEYIAVSSESWVRIWDVVTGTVRHIYAIPYSDPCMVYSHKFNQLAIVASSASGSAITIIDPHTGTPIASHPIDEKISCFSFSQTTKKLLCSLETNGLQVFDVSTQRLERIDYPGTIISVSSLQNGTVVGHSAGSGIQLLSLDDGHTPSQQPTVSALTVHAFDEGRIITVFLTGRDHIVLLDPATMSQLLKIPVRKTDATPLGKITILCASRENRMAVYHFGVGGEWFLQLWRFHEEVPRWTVQVDRMLKVGRISPTAVWFVTLHDTLALTERPACIRIWSTQNGELMGKKGGKLCGRMPDQLDGTGITFTSHSQFWLHHDISFMTYTVDPQGRITIDAGGEVAPPPRPERLQKKQPFFVNSAGEWVICDACLKKVFSIPPGYIGSTRPSYCWAGSTLVMAGQDGILRKITFSYDHAEDCVGIL